MNDYVIFTEEMFVARVRMCIEMFSKELNIGLKSQVPIRISNRMTRGLGKHVYGNNKSKEIVYSAQLLDGRFILSAVDDILIHEVAHYLIFQQTGMSQGHNAKFKATCAILGCNASSSGAPKLSSLGLKMDLDSDYKYSIVCECCGQVINYTRMCSSVKYPNNYTCTLINNGVKCGGRFERLK